MRPSNLRTLSALLALAAVPATAQVQPVHRLQQLPAVQGGTVAPGAKDQIVVQGGLTAPAKPTEAIGPKQDDPLTVGPGGGCDGLDPSGVLAIGPKQDDPRAPALGQLARDDDGNDPQARRGVLAIGPKQDDPRTPALGQLARDDDGNDPQARNEVLAIGPKQDDPRAPNAMAAALQRPGDDDDPKARCIPSAGGHR